MGTADLYFCDAVEFLGDYIGPKFHALLCDPPYNLESIQKRFGKKDAAPAQYGNDGAFFRVSRGFMGKEWDTNIAMRPETWKIIKRVLHPGAFCMAFSSTRTYHRMATAIEDAGFILHPMIGWIQGSGFPKATNIHIQLEKDMFPCYKVEENGKNVWRYKDTKELLRTEPPFRNSGADIWYGHRYGLQTLKPSFEPICVFQKSYEGKPLQNIVDTGAGAIWVEGARIGEDVIPVNVLEEWSGLGQVQKPDYEQKEVIGRWPANVVVSDYEVFPYDKFFYCAKANRKERDAGLEDMPDTMFGQSGGAKSKLKDGEEEYLQDSIGLNRIKKVKNPHPTVKPIDLCRWLATLLLPPATYKDRRLLVPFSGTGSEVIGGLQAGWDLVTGIEIDLGYTDIAGKRIEWWMGLDKE